MPSLVAIIQSSSDPSKMEELLALNDSLTSLLAETGWSRLQNGGPVNGSSTYEGSVLSNSSLDTSRSPSPQASQPAKDGSPKIPSAPPALSIQTDVPIHESDIEDGELSTPRVDKGKGRAEPEPEQPEKILSPTPSFLIATSDDEDEDAGKARFVELLDEGATIGSPSPTDLSRSWVEEEGEVFRKGNVLLTEEEMEGEYDGDQLRIEILTTEVERPPPRPLTDEFGLEIGGVPQSPRERDPEQSPVTPTSPRPYLPRRRSSKDVVGGDPSTKE